MDVQIFLVAPVDADPQSFPALLAEVLAAAPVAALLLLRGERDEQAYAALARAVLPIAQQADCAVLLDNEPALVKPLGADGVHMSTGLKAFQAAIAALKPDHIVGAGDIHSRHDAMLKGEAGADYVFFGTPGTPATAETSGEATWWAETFEVPCVLFEPEPARLAACPCEFIGLGLTLWQAPEGPAAALAALAGQGEPGR